MDTYCFVPDCGQATIADEYAPGADALRKQPEMDLFCLVHFRSLIADRKARAAAAKTRCDFPHCEAIGALYPGGRRCKDHAPGVLIPRLGLLSSAAGHQLTDLPRIAGRNVVDIELPGTVIQGASPVHREKFVDAVLEVAEMPGEPILYSTELSDDDPRLNSTIKSALKLAREHGWRIKTTVAIANDEMFSILVKFRHPTGKQLTTRHERPAGKTLGFKKGWLQYSPTGMPNSVGWRDSMTFLRGTDPLDDRAALITAMEHVMDSGGDVVRVEIV